MANPFDQFDTAAQQANPFDRFDAPAQAQPNDIRSWLFPNASKPRAPITSQSVNVGPLESQRQMPNQAAPFVPQSAEVNRQQWGDVLGGAATGTLMGAPGMIGNMEGAGRAGLNAIGVPVSMETKVPTSSALGNMVAGEPSSPQASAGRFIGEMASPWAYGKLATHVIGPLLKNWAGLRTGAGPTPIQQAFDAGAEGGPTNEAFTANMRGKIPFNDVVDQAKTNLSSMYAARSKAYRDAMSSGVISDPMTLDFQPIKDAISKTANVGTYNGVSLSKSADKVREAVSDTLKEWEALPPDQFHTAQGLDALKQKLGDLQFEGELSSAAQRGSPGAKIINGVRNAVKDQIVQNFPKYAEVMKDYHDTSDELWNIEKSLSLGDKVSVDTSMGKLQSLMRNDVNSRFGGRLAMGAKLNAAGDETMLPSLAGQSLSSPYPRGLNKALSSGEAATAFFVPHLAPKIAADMAMSSPRLVGEVAHGLGVLARPFQQVPFGFGGGANIGSSFSPQLLGAMTPQVLARLLLTQQSAQPTQ